jgi:hypothetical protein
MIGQNTSINLSLINSDYNYKDFVIINYSLYDIKNNYWNRK